MNTRFTPFIIMALGVVVFGAGMDFRLYAANLAVTALSGGPSKLLEGIMDPHKGDYSEAIALSQRANAMHDIALPLLWAGGAMLVTGAIAQFLIPVWQTRYLAPVGSSPDASGQPQSSGLC